MTNLRNATGGNRLSSRHRRRLSACLFGLAVGGVVAFWYCQPGSTTQPRIDNAERAEELLKAKKVLVVVAHPDDAEFYMAGTLKALTERGATVWFVQTCAGDKGLGRTLAPSATRLAEQRGAAAVEGVQKVLPLGTPDRTVSRCRDSLRRKYLALLQSWRPDTILGFDPQFPLRDEHPDHAEVACILIEASQAYGSGLRSRPPALFLTATRRPDLWVDVTRYQITRSEAIAQHRSQFRGLRLWVVQWQMRAMAAAEGKKSGLSAAETFREVKLASGHGRSP
ncbi:MAG: PIG-L family deacetylase [Armatimonadetes bacterium]|nr:PIG-L family deacetylase [Armatimonadota bacterium]